MSQSTYFNDVIFRIISSNYKALSPNHSERVVLQLSSLDINITIPSLHDTIMMTSQQLNPCLSIAVAILQLPESRSMPREAKLQSEQEINKRKDLPSRERIYWEGDHSGARTA